MVHEVITLPLRIGADATRLGLRAVNLGLGIADRLIELAVPRPTEHVPAARAETHPVPPAPPPPPRAAAPEPEPAHVSREAHLVQAFADPGAEDGAGATVRIEEPWKGYERMTADDVIDRLAAASGEVLAAVALYERAHRNRSTVVAAAQRRLRQATGAAR